MRVINHFLNYFYALTLSVKTRILIVVTALGILFVGIVATVMLFGIKNSFDSLFYTRTLSLSKLQNIKDVYTLNIYNTYRDILENNTKIEPSLEVIEISKQNINLRWNEYKNIRKKNVDNGFFQTINQILIYIFLNPIPNTITVDENEIFLKTVKSFDRLSKATQQIQFLLNHNQPQEANKAILENLFPVIDVTNIYLEQLINYHIKNAIYEKEITDAIFEATFWIIFVIIFWVIGVSVFLAYFILENIKYLHQSLEVQVKEKTKELQILNTSLEYKIAQEIKQSRIKDEILHQQAKLASMGEMIGNIAHQWRQPLNALTMLIQSFQIKNMSGKLSSDFIVSQVNEGVRISKNMSDTIDEFRNYFKPNKEKINFDLKRCIQDSLFLVERVLNNSGVKVLIEAKNNFEIFGYPNGLAQVLINLLNNANDALKAKIQDEKFVLIGMDKKIIQHQEYIIIKIIDNGGGIEKKYINKLFEPYFTTKHKSVGTGIGLYMSKKIVEEQFGGYIKAKNIKYVFNEIQYNCALFKIIIPYTKESNAA